MRHTSSPGNCRRTHKLVVNAISACCETRFLTLPLISSFFFFFEKLKCEICLISQCFIIRCENSRFCVFFLRICMDIGHACLPSNTNWNRKWLWKFFSSFFIYRFLCCRISHWETRFIKTTIIERIKWQKGLNWSRQWWSDTKEMVGTHLFRFSKHWKCNRIVRDNCNCYNWNRLYWLNDTLNRLSDSEINTRGCHRWYGMRKFHLDCCCR